MATENGTIKLVGWLVGQIHNQTINQINAKDTKVLFGLVFAEIISSTSRCPQRSLSSQSLGKYWQLNQHNKHAEINCKTQHNKTTLIKDKVRWSHVMFNGSQQPPSPMTYASVSSTSESATTVATTISACNAVTRKCSCCPVQCYI